MRSLYPADAQGGKSNIQFGIRPFDFVRLEISGSDEPVSYPQFSGTGLYIDRCDYPATIVVTDTQTRVAQSYVMRPGLEINVPFSGFVVMVPVLSLRRGIFAEIIVCKGGARYTIGRDSSDIQNIDSYSVTTDTAVLKEFSIMIPPGASILRRLEIGMTATTITQALVTPVEAGIAASGRGAVADPRNGAQYNTPSAARSYGAVSAAGTFQRVIFEHVPFWLRNNALYLQFVGTGMDYANMSIVSRFE